MANFWEAYLANKAGKRVRVVNEYKSDDWWWNPKEMLQRKTFETEILETQWLIEEPLLEGYVVIVDEEITFCKTTEEVWQLKNRNQTKARCAKMREVRDE